LNVLFRANVIEDVTEAHLLNSIVYNSTASSNEAIYDLYVAGDMSPTQKVIDAQSGSAEYLFPMRPSPNTFFRGKHLLDLR
jgi:hypothetical protein